MVAALVGADLATVVGEGAHATVDLVVASLASAPGALLAFLAAAGVVAFGGAVLMFIVKAGTFRALINGEERLETASGGDRFQDEFGQAKAFTLTGALMDSRQFARRAAVLATWLSAAYALLAIAYFAAMSGIVRVAESPRWAPAWPVLVLAATSLAVVSAAIINLSYDLLRVIVLTDDCSPRAAVDRLRHFVVADARQVVGIFSVIGGVTLLGTLASVLAATGLAVVAWIPFVTLLIVPMQLAVWVLRGLIFQYLSLAALAAYQTQYRRWTADRQG
jgi:hypothetical protein